MKIIKMFSLLQIEFCTEEHGGFTHCTPVPGIYSNKTVHLMFEKPKPLVATVETNGLKRFKETQFFTTTALTVSYSKYIFQRAF